MNEIKVNVNFKNRTINKVGAILTSGDYNSTKLVFSFDNQEGRKVFEMKDANDDLVMVKEIINNEVILVGEVDVTTKVEDVTYTKYLDNEENVYWYDAENDKLYDYNFEEDETTELESLIKQTKDASLFSEEGKYPFEISLYDGESKLSSASDYLMVKQEAVVIDGEVVEAYLPIFDDLLNRVQASLNQVDNVNINASKSGTITTITITKKDGTTITETILDGEKGEKGDTYTITSADYTAIATIVKGDIVIPVKLSDLTNDTGFITNAVNNLTNYYLKSETYTKQEVQNLIGQISTIRLQKVNSLPVSGETGIIYLVPNQSQEQRNIFDEYIWIDNDWEKIGDTEIDLTGYATETWVTNQISNFLTSSEITSLVNTALANYYTKGQIDALLNDKANASLLNDYVQKATTIAGVDLQDNVTKSELLTALNVEDGADVNSVESISAGGTTLTPDANKNVNIPYATQNVGGVAKMWTSLNEDNEIGLNISTE